MEKTIEQLKAAGFSVTEEFDNTFTVKSEKTGATVLREVKYSELEKMLVGIEYLRTMPAPVARHKARPIREWKSEFIAHTADGYEPAYPLP
jgi:hypothetical protein